jgi:spermidine/putrescine-binding protein
MRDAGAVQHRGQVDRTRDRAAGVPNPAERRARGGGTGPRRFAGCGADDEDGTTTLTWYTNPDNGGQENLATTCTESVGGDYRIEVSVLPTDADSQREQLVRRLAANDSPIDLTSLDVVFVPEFAEAGLLRPLRTAILFPYGRIVAGLPSGAVKG